MVTLSVPSGQTLATQSLQATLTQAVDGTTTRTLQQPLVISLVKSAVYATYALTYVANFNSRPTELVALTTDCKDGSYQADASCGWFLDAGGARVPDSQGFCCPCTAQSSWQQSVLGGATDQSRGNVNCNLFAANLFLSGVPASAHCLRLDPDAFAGYSLGSAEYEFQLSVAINAAPANGTAALPTPGEVLVLSPATVVALGANGSVAAELLGDLGGFQDSPVLSQSMLFVPRPANGSSPGDPALWPLLPTSAVSLDGSRCNVPGTSFSAFRNQANACAQPAGACLGNQLADIVAADAARVAAGQAPRNNVAALGVGAAALHTALPGAMSPLKKRLALPCGQLRNSIVVLSLAADDIRFVVDVSPGYIANATLVSFTGQAAGGFTSLSGNGYIAATIVNNGTLAASYYLSVVNCSDGVALVPSPGALAVPARGALTQTWACSVQDDQAAQRNCTVVLQDAAFVTIDSKLVRFYTNATVYDVAPTHTGGIAGTGPGAGPGPPVTCESLCPSIMNVWCAAINWCWLRLLYGLLLFAFLLGFAYWTFVRCGPCALVKRLSPDGSGAGGKPRPSPATRLTPMQPEDPAWAAAEVELAALEAALAEAGRGRRGSGGERRVSALLRELRARSGSWVRGEETRSCKGRR